MKPWNLLTEARAHLWLERACLAAVRQRLSTVSASSARVSRVRARVVIVMAGMRVY